MESMKKGSAYHHGDLRIALVDAAIDLIEQHGVRGFSVAQASKRLGVSVAAPYRHFKDREDLLVAVAERSAAAMAAVVGEPLDGATPEEQLTAAARGYVRFAAHHPALFEALFTGVVDKDRHPDLRDAAAPVGAAFVGPAQALCEGDSEAGKALATAVAVAAHGHAALLLDGMFGATDAVGRAEAHVSRVTSALIAGRALLQEGE